MQTMHRLMEMLSGANVNYSETNFDDKRDLEELVHPYVCNFLLILSFTKSKTVRFHSNICQSIGFPIKDICVCNGFDLFTISLL